MESNLIMLVTGNSSGIGREITKHYLDKGFRVIGCSRSSVDYKSENYLHFTLDISNEESVVRMFKEINHNYGRLDVLINNAGAASMNYLLLTTLKEIKTVVETNLYGTFLSSREGVKLMKRNKYGRIINISSIHTDIDIHGCSIYSSTKAAIEKFSSQIANEVHQYGITSNIISLSVVSDIGMSKNLADSVIEKILQKSPSGNVIEINDVIKAIDKLIMPDNNEITGQKIVIG